MMCEAAAAAEKAEVEETSREKENNPITCDGYAALGFLVGFRDYGLVNLGFILESKKSISPKSKKRFSALSSLSSSSQLQRGRRTKEGGPCARHPTQTKESPPELERAPSMGAFLTMTAAAARPNNTSEAEASIPVTKARYSLRLASRETQPPCPSTKGKKRGAAEAPTTPPSKLPKLQVHAHHHPSHPSPSIPSLARGVAARPFSGSFRGDMLVFSR